MVIPASLLFIYIFFLSFSYSFSLSPLMKMMFKRIVSRVLLSDPNILGLLLKKPLETSKIISCGEKPEGSIPQKIII